MKASFLISTLSGALLLSSAAIAQVQGQQQSDVFSQMLGAMFGTSQQASEQTLESDWNQGRQPFEQRRAQLDARIDGAVRDGSLSPREAEQMRRDYDDIVRLEAQYSADGSVSDQQRNDLRMRYRALTQRVSGQGYGQGYRQDGYGQDGYGQDGRWQPLATRSAAFEQRLSMGLRNREMTPNDAARLRADWQALARVEASYARGGIDAREQADLWARYNAIDRQIGGRGNGGFGNDRNPARWSQLETRLAASERSGSISRDDAVQVRAQLGDLARLDTVYASDGYSADQRSYLMRRYADINATLGAYRR